MNPREKEVTFQKPHFLILTFTNNERRRFSFQPYTQFRFYSKLENQVFAQNAKCVNGTVAWNDMIDFDPDILYLESEALN